MTIDRNSRNFSFPSQLGIFLGLIGAGLILGTLISAGLWMAMTGRPLMSMETDMLNPKYYNAIMLMQVISTFFMFFLPVYIFAIICYRNPSKFIGFHKNINYQQLFLVLGILILTFPLSGALAEINKMIPLPKTLEIKFKAMEASRAAQEDALININSFPRYLFSMIVIGLLPGIFEEVCFRGGLQNIFIRWFKNPWMAIILTAILFSIIHISYYGFFVRFALGIVLGYIFYYSGSIWLSILFHFLYNGIQVTALYVTTMAGNKSSKDIEENFPLWAGIIALILIVYAFIKFREISLLQKKKYAEEDAGDPNDFQNWVQNNPKTD
ncbi:MAG: type II CAAX endopeptidase family protein [Bacteroidota bacterium]|nr:type II CAAX endopeptidase family protein [Bacteroidota bacterium]